MIPEKGGRDAALLFCVGIVAAVVIVEVDRLDSHWTGRFRYACPKSMLMYTASLAENCLLDRWTGYFGLFWENVCKSASDHAMYTFP